MWATGLPVISSLAADKARYKELSHTYRERDRIVQLVSMSYTPRRCCTVVPRSQAHTFSMYSAYGCVEQEGHGKKASLKLTLGRKAGSTL